MTAPANIIAAPASWAAVIFFCGAPSRPRRSMQRLSDICPRSSAMKNAPAPMRGMSQALPQTASAPHMPPSHIHHGPPLNAPRMDFIRPVTAQKRAAAATAAAKDIAEALTAEPSIVPSEPYIAPIVAIRHPAPTPDRLPQPDCAACASARRAGLDVRAGGCAQRPGDEQAGR